MFGFKKKDSTVKLFAPVDGEFVKIEKVSDPVFSEKAMGDGFAVRPSCSTIVSPVSATIKSIFRTKHAIGLVTNSKIEILLHMGLDTVELNGAPFKISVHEGDQVAAGDVLGSMDIDYITEHDKDPIVITILTNMDLIQSFSTNTSGKTKAGDEVGKAVLK